VNLKILSSTVLNHITAWFHANQLVLNLDKTNIVKFTPTNIVHNPLTIEYVGKVLTEVNNFKFLGLHIDSHLNWRWHIEWILPKLSTACYTNRKLSHVLNTDVYKIVYFAKFHSVIEYGIIFWGNSSNIGNVFLL
jgi:Uri superfamily endonuclease